MKNQIQKLKTKLTGRGSILVYTLIVMMIMLSTALSIFAVAVREKKGAGLTAASMQAFAVADSGSEIALQAADKNTAIDSLPDATNCNSTTGTVTINVAGGTADITFYSDEAATTALGCGVSAGSAQKVKSVGRYGGTARAVEVAVALTGSGVVGGCAIDLRQPSGSGPEKTHAFIDDRWSNGCLIKDTDLGTISGSDTLVTNCAKAHASGYACGPTALNYCICVGQ